MPIEYYSRIVFNAKRPSTPNAIHYQIFAVSERSIYFKILQEKNVLNLLVSQEPIKRRLLFAFSTQLLQAALESAHNLYSIERISTNQQTVLLKHPTCSEHLFKRWRHHFGVVLIGIRINLLNIASSLRLYHQYYLHISIIGILGVRERARDKGCQCRVQVLCPRRGTR